MKNNTEDKINKNNKETSEIDLKINWNLLNIPFPTYFSKSFTFSFFETYNISSTPSNTQKTNLIFQLILINLYSSSNWISIAKSCQRSVKNKNCDKNYLSRYILNQVLEYLDNFGFIETKSHYFKAHKAPENRYTRIRITPRLKRVFKGKQETLDSILEGKVTTEIVVRDKDKNDIIDEFPNNPILSERKKVLDKYKNLLEQHSLKTPCRNLIDLRFRTVFNHTPERGGRLYHNVYRLKKEERGLMTIDDQETVEVDFASLHIVLLYNLAKIDVTQLDLYSVGCVDRSKSKLAMLIMINAKNKKEAISSYCQKEFRDESSEGFIPCMKTWFKLKKEEARIVFEELQEKHYQIKEYFFSNISLDLMKIDSDLLFDCIDQLTDLSIPSFPVHDSLIVPVTHQLTVRSIMTKTIEKYLQITLPFSPIGDLK